MRRAVATVLLLCAASTLPACSAVEKICEPGKVAIERDGGGRSCEEPEPGDKECPSGEILLKNPDAGVKGCIENKYSPDSYTEKLTKTNNS